MCSSWTLGTLLRLKFRMDRSPLSVKILLISIQLSTPPSFDSIDSSRGEEVEMEEQGGGWNGKSRGVPD